MTLTAMSRLRDRFLKRQQQTTAVNDLLPAQFEQRSSDVPAVTLQATSSPAAKPTAVSQYSRMSPDVRHQSSPSSTYAPNPIATSLTHSNTTEVEQSDMCVFKPKASTDRTTVTLPSVSPLNVHELRAVIVVYLCRPDLYNYSCPMNVNSLARDLRKQFRDGNNATSMQLFKPAIVEAQLEWLRQELDLLGFPDAVSLSKLANLTELTGIKLDVLTRYVLPVQIPQLPPHHRSVQAAATKSGPSASSQQLTVPQPMATTTHPPPNSLIATSKGVSQIAGVGEVLMSVCIFSCRLLLCCIGGRSISEDSMIGASGSTAAGQLTSVMDLEALLSAPSAKKQKQADMGSGLLQLVNEATAMQTLIARRFMNKDGTNLKEFCTHRTRMDCAKARADRTACAKVHFRRVILQHTGGSAVSAAAAAAFGLWLHSEHTIWYEEHGSKCSLLH